MSSLYVSDPDSFAEAADVVRLFTGETHIEQLRDAQPARSGRSIVVSGGAETAAFIYEDGREVCSVTDHTVFLPLVRDPERARVRQFRHLIKRALYQALAKTERRQLPWGALTGIRPVKLFRELAAVHGEEAAEREFSRSYGVDPERTALCRTIYREQEQLLAGWPDGLCVYAGIPFCPTRCRYCSFIAQDVAAAKEARGEYLGALLAEIRAAADQAGPAASIYIGGGTPTTLRAPELEQLIRTLRGAFPDAPELTLEAGRPDTIRKDLLEMAAALGVTRLSINPQTASDETLRRIGRSHTAADYERAMQLARPSSLRINSDMIIGLPGEHVSDVMATLDMILAGAPDNITVHALAVKKASDLALSSDWTMMPPEEAAQAAGLVASRLQAAGYRPYYLYRQKYMSGNLENVGYALPGTGCLYNVLHMEELASVLAFGAGAISKRVYPGGGRIERCANVKDVRQYVERIGEMMERKEQLFAP